MSFAFLTSWWDTVRTSLWFVPVICVTIAIALSIALPEIDQQVLDEDDAIPPWIFAGSADGARSILSTIAGGLITITGVIFSITIVVLQQASSQFTPRVMGNFMRQTGTQIVLGVFIATFLYSVLVLRYVRGEDALASEFVPRLSVAVSVVLATVCLGLLVYFIHHMATSIQASMVIASVNHEFQEDIQRIYPEHVGEPLQDLDQPLETFRQDFMRPPVTTVYAEQSGFVRSVDDQWMLEYAPGCEVVAILPQIGHFVTLGAPMVEISGTSELTEKQMDGVRSAFVLGKERSRYQDPLFSIRQLVDIALKALSPSINDPTTTKNCISMLSDSIAQLAHRSFPERIRTVSIDADEGQREVWIWTNRPTFQDFVECAFSEIRREARSNVAVTGHLIDTLGALGHRISTIPRAQAIHWQLNEIERAIEQADFAPVDVHVLQALLESSRQALPARL